MTTTHQSETRPAIREWTEQDRRVFEVNAPRVRWVTVAGPIWLAGWCFGLYGAIFALGLGHRGYALLDLFLLFWLVLWIVGGVFVIGVVLWAYLGRERVTIGGDSLTVQRLILGRGRKEVYHRAEVNDLRFQDSRTDFFGSRTRWSMLGLGPGKVCFDYRGRVRSFGLGLTDEDARKLVRRLAELVPDA